MQNKYFITSMVSKVSKGIFTYFLTEKETNEVIISLNRSKQKYNIYTPYKGADKKIIYSKIKPKVTLLEIIGDSNIRHKDILGSLFALGIKPYMYGDIIIGEKKYLIVLDEISTFIKNNLYNIGKYKVSVKNANINVLTNYEKEYIEKKVILKSIRLDSLVSKLINKSRESAKKIISEKLVLLNFNITNKNSVNLTEGDIISIRGYGKYKIDKIIKDKKVIINVLMYK